MSTWQSNLFLEPWHLYLFGHEMDKWCWTSTIEPLTETTQHLAWDVPVIEEAVILFPDIALSLHLKGKFRLLYLSYFLFKIIWYYGKDDFTRVVASLAKVYTQVQGMMKWEIKPPWLLYRLMFNNPEGLCPLASYKYFIFKIVIETWGWSQSNFLSCLIEE